MKYLLRKKYKQVQNNPTYYTFQIVAFFFFPLKGQGQMVTKNETSLTYILTINIYIDCLTFDLYIDCDL